jgi:type III secretion system FlhB-like substrate exporter
MKNTFLKNLLLVTVSLCSVSLKAEEPTGIEVDESNFKEIFNRSVTEQADTVSNRAKSFDVEVSASYLTLTELDLKNNYYNIDYSDSFKTMPALQVAGAWQLVKMGGLKLAPYVAAGYGFKEEKIVATTNKTGVPLKDIVSLHTVPLVAGLQIKHHIPGTKRFSVFAIPTAGAQWFYQSGTLDGINDSYWIPFWGARAGVVLFESNRTSSVASWFEGVTVGTSYRSSLGSSQTLQAWSADLGLKILL